MIIQYRIDNTIQNPDFHHLHLFKPRCDYCLRPHQLSEGNTYPGNDLENILNEIHANRQELYIDDIKKKFIESHVEKRELTTVPEIPLRVTTTTYYKTMV
jgi:hypothetical protein